MSSCCVEVNNLSVKLQRDVCTHHQSFVLREMGHEGPASFLWARGCWTPFSVQPNTAQPTNAQSSLAPCVCPCMYFWGPTMALNGNVIAVHKSCELRDLRRLEIRNHFGPRKKICMGAHRVHVWQFSMVDNVGGNQVEDKPAVW